MNQETLSSLKKKLEKIFNSYIRERDKDKPCISCGQYFEKKDAGHFFAKSGYQGLRFDEYNVNGECARCNRFDESHLISYAENLRKRLGEETYNALKERAEDYKRFGYKFSRQELRDMIEEYKDKLLSIK